jgi:hypothetical protein
MPGLRGQEQENNTAVSATFRALQTAMHRKEVPHD